MVSAIRTLPGNAITGHSPEVFLHAVLADGESAPTSPAKRRMLAAAGAGTFFCYTTLFFIWRQNGLFFHIIC